jgi:cytochrome c oxidase subunit I
MTLTAPTSTSQAVDTAVFGAVADPFDPVQADDWVASVDAQHTGQLHLGFLAAVIAIAGALGVAVHGSLGSRFTLNETGSLSLGSLFALHQNLWAVSIAMPLWIAVATMVVPGQIGATRTAFPRLGNLAMWGWFFGTAILIVATFVDDGPQTLSLLNALPWEGSISEAPRAVDLALGAVMLVTVATLAGAINLVATILTERAPGQKLSTLRPFSWSVLVTMGFAIVTTPVFLAGTFLVYLDQHFAGQVFGSGIGANRVWVHAIWLFGRPEAVLLAIPAVGAVADVFVSRMGRPLIGGATANYLITAAAATSLTTWAGREILATTVTPPYARIWTAIVIVPLFLLLLVIAGSAKGGLKPDASLLPALGVILTIAAGAGLTLAIVAAPNDNIKSPLNAQVGLPNLLVFGLVLLGAVTVLTEHATHAYGWSLNKGGMTLVALAMLGGVLLSGAGLAAGAFSDGTAPHDGALLGKVLIAGGAALLIATVLGSAAKQRSASQEGSH